MNLWRGLSIACLALVVAVPAAVSAGAQPAPKAVAAPEIRVADNVFLVPDKNARSITGWLIVLAGCADEAEIGRAHV